MDTSMKASAAKMDNNPPKLVIKKMSVLDKFKLKNVGIVQALQRAVAKSSGTYFFFYSCKSFVII